MKALVPLLVSVVLGAGLTTPAHAASERWTDEQGDVNVRRAKDRPTTEAPWADVTSFRTTYSRKKLVVRTRLAEPITKRDQNVFVAVAIQTSDGDVYSAALRHSIDYPASEVSLFGGPVDLPQKCRYDILEGRANRAGTKLTIEIPARCVGNAVSLRTAGQIRVVKGDGTKIQWHDDARSGYRVPGEAGAYETPTYGPEIARG